MMRSAILLAVLAPHLLVGCATIPHPTPLEPSEKAAVCAMAQNIRWEPYGTVEWEKDPSQVKRLDGLVPEQNFKSLPPTVSCPEGRQWLHSSKDGIPFESFWLSEDGRNAAITGGWIGGPTLGGGGVCYFVRADEKWQRDGCISTWAI
jgi:hypothetical protein